MAIVQNTYTGNGSTTLYSLSFPYLDETDVKVTLNGVATTSFVFVNASTIQFISAPANGVAIRIYRETDIDTQTATFFAGSAIRAQDLNDNITQTLYAVQESNFEADTATTTANTALTNSNTAISTANTASTNASNAVTTANTANANASAAVTTANTANTNASAAVSTANTASTNASAAVTTANTALSTANSATTTANNAVSTANSALSAANSAVSTANTASTNATAAVNTANTASSNASTAVTTANNALSTANTALSNSATAISTANSAIAAVASAVIYTPVANLTALAALTPANGDYFELTDSTGAESSALITGVTVGLVGAPGLTFRLRYDAPPGIFTFLGYFANDSETRYLKFSGGTLTGQLRGDDSASAATPGFAFDGDANTGVGRPGADELALITGGSARLTINSAGAVAIPGTLGVTGAITGSLTGAASSNVLKAGDTMTGALVHPLGAAATPSITFTGDTNTGIYSPGADQVAISTNGTGRMFINANGRLLVGTSSSITTVDHAANSGAPLLQVGGTSVLLSSVLLNSWGTGAASASNLQFAKSKSGTVDTRGVVASGDNLGALVFEGDDGTNFIRAALIRADVDGAPATNDMPGRLVFSTTPSGSPTPQERMRLDSSGRLGLGTSSPLSINLVDGTTAIGPVLDIKGTGTSNNTSGALALTRKDAGTGSVIYSSGDDGGLVLRNTDSNGFAFINGTTTAVRITAAGRVGIGTTSPGNKLHVKNGSADDYVRIEHESNDTQLRIQVSSSASRVGLSATYNSTGSYYPLAFLTSDTERARIDTSGRLLVGTSSDVSGEAAALIQSVYSTGALTSIGRDDTTVNNGDFIGGIDFHTKTGASSTWQRSARILCWADADQGSGDAPGRLTFSVTADGASSPSEAMRISNSRNTSFTGAILPSSDNAYQCGASGQRWSLIYAANGTIQTSDQRDKTEIAEASLGSNFIKSLKPVSYKFVVGSNKDAGVDEEGNRVYEAVPGKRTHWGFIAQEVKEAADEAGVDFGGWVLTDIENPDSPQGLRYDQFIAPLTKALQEALAEIDILKAKVAALEAA